MHYLITGHTGFKGSWLTLFLAEMGHTVSGVALDPEPASLFNHARIGGLLKYDIRADIRDNNTMPAALRQCRPDVLIHMAAQPLVRESYRKPRMTFETNVMGTLNVLEATSAADSVRAQLIVTTDKVYRNVGRVAGYTEHEPLGGDDPYSASKAMADLLTQSWVTSFPGPPTAVARAGNVIGGGDYSSDRLIPDVVAAFGEGRTVELRYPDAVRPWQHVLDCLGGYLTVVEHLVNSWPATRFAGPWNIGPGRDSFRSVADVTSLVGDLWDGPTSWERLSGDHPHEAHLLALDSTRARTELGWTNQLSFDEAVKWTVEWYLAIRRGQDPQTVTAQQIGNFVNLSNAGQQA